MKARNKLLLFVLITLTFAVNAQLDVSGTVTDSETGEPILGANIIVKGTTNGTTTDFEGEYTISSEIGETLQFSYLGYSTMELVIASNTLNVVLQENASQLDEVVIIGYGSVKKEDLTGAVDLITEEDFNDGPIVSAQQLIQGKIAGVSVTSGSGAPGSGQAILVRGNGSLSLSSSPLIVIDGLPIDNNGVGGSRNPLNLINPNDIESMTVLKDASATAIYGSRAANGVIIVTTKKGKNTEFKFNVSSSTTMHTPIAQVDLLTPNEFRNVVATHPQADATTLAILGNANTNWQDEIYTTAFGSDHSISALGSALGVPMRLSLGHTDHDGILKRDNFTRTTASINLTPSLLDDHIRLELNARGTYTENFFANRGAIGSASNYDPTQPVFDANSPFGGYSGYLADPDNDGQLTQISLSPTNPVALLNLVDNDAEVRRFVGNAKLDYKLHFFEDLTATVNVGLDKSNSNGRTITSELLSSSDPLWNGSHLSYSQESTNKLFDAYLTYSKSVNDKHNVTVVGGYSYQSFEYDNYNYNSELEEQGNTFEFINKSKNVLLSYFGRLNYDFDGRYLLTATLRADASSKLNPNDRWGYFPSLAASWNIHNENFLAESSVINQLKLRVGYGEVGNVNGLGDYLFLTRYTRSDSAAGYQFGNAFYQTYRPDPINENLRWEIGNTLNVGLDYSLFNSRISGSVNAYIKETQDLIAFSSVDPFTNFGTQINSNIGDMENKGIEAMINVVPIRTDNVEWSIGYNISFNDNVITNLPSSQAVGGISGGVGTTVQTHQEGEAPFSYLVFQQAYDTDGSPIEGAFVDRNGDNIINNDDQYIYKDPYADVIMGLNTNLNYKKWNLAVITRANLGNYAYNNVASSTAYLNGVIPSTNDFVRNIHADYLNTGFVNQTVNNFLSSHYIQEASFFKIDNITLGYTLDDAIKGTTINLSASLQNVATITDYDGLDPEITGGIDNNFYPRPRSFVFGVNLDF